MYVAVINGHAMNVCLVLTWKFSSQCIGQAIHLLAIANTYAVVGFTAGYVFFKAEITYVRIIPIPIFWMRRADILLGTSIPKYTVEGENPLAVTLSGAKKALMKYIGALLACRHRCRVCKSWREDGLRNHCCFSHQSEPAALQSSTA